MVIVNVVVYLLMWHVNYVLMIICIDTVIITIKRSVSSSVSTYYFPLFLFIGLRYLVCMKNLNALRKFNSCLILSHLLFHSDHLFFHKWALLTDPDDFLSGPKGYLKCDVGIIGKGDTVKVPPRSDKDPDDIEA